MSSAVLIRVKKQVKTFGGKVRELPPQYGGDGTYHLLSFGMRVNKQRMTANEARERNAERKKNGNESVWWWSGYASRE